MLIPIQDVLLQNLFLYGNHQIDGNKYKYETNKTLKRTENEEQDRERTKEIIRNSNKPQAKS